MNRFAKYCLIGLALVCFSPYTPAQTPTREAMRQEMADLQTKLRSLEDAYLQPSEEDKKLYAAFLQQSGTGLIRLLPREVVDKKGAELRGGGAYYSFTRLTHEYGYGSDISLEQEQFHVGFAGANYGLLLTLGKTPLEAVTVESGVAAFLAGYPTPSTEPEARIEQRKASAGFTDDEGRLYKNRVPAEVGKTYLLRSVDYGDSDVLAVFQTIRKDLDGSFTLIWKLLKTYPKPDLKRSDK